MTTYLFGACMQDIPKWQGPVWAKVLVDFLVENRPAPPLAFTLQIYLLHEWICTEDPHIRAPSYKTDDGKPNDKGD
jgi:hypothetical protein